MEETANSLEVEIATRRRDLEDQKLDLNNKETARNAIKDKLEAVNATKATGSKSGARKKKAEVKSLEQQISERESTILEVRQDIEDKRQVLEEMNDRLAAIKLKEATTARLSQFPHKKFRQSQHQGIAEPDTTLKTKNTYLQPFEGQLEEVGLENEPQPTDVNWQHQENVFKLDPVKSVLSTPEIWRKIFGKLDNSSLMGARLVAKSWNKRVLKIFANTKRDQRSRCGSYLCLTNLLQTSTSASEADPDFNSDNYPVSDSDSESKSEYKSDNCSDSDSGSNSDDCSDSYVNSKFPSYDPKLPAAIIFHDFRGDKCCNFSRYKCLTLCSQLSPKVARLDLQTTPAMASTLFNEMISKGCFPNLESFKLSFEAGSSYFLSKKSTLAKGSFPRLNLQHIDITVVGRLWNRMSKPFKAWIQLLIDTAPNLKKMAINGNFYPDLSKNKKVEVLRIRYEFLNKDFSEAKFSKLLAQVKDCVKIAELEAALFFETGRQDSLPCRFPVMKKLKSLNLYDAMIDCLEQDEKPFVTNIATNFPALEHLQIIKTFEYNNDSVQDLLNCGLQMVPTIHSNLQSLSLTYVKNPSDLRHLATWFPNLTSLELSFSRVTNETTALLLTGLGGLQLKELQLTIQYLYVLKLSQLIKALTSHPTLFNGMEHLEIIAKVQQRRFPEPYPVATTDDLDREDKDGKSLSGMRQVFCDWLECTTINMKSVLFRGFTFSNATESEVFSVIRRKKLPVKLIKNDGKIELSV